MAILFRQTSNMFLCAYATDSLLLAWARTKWSACGRKKVVLALMLIVAWSLSSVPTRICGGRSRAPLRFYSITTGFFL